MTRRMLVVVLALGFLFALLASALPFAAGAEAPRRGDLLIATDERGGGKLVAVDPSTGVSTVILATPGISLADVAVSPAGVIYVLGEQEISRRAVILRLDASSGNATPVFEFESVSMTSRHLAAGPGEVVYIPGPDGVGIMRIDAATGIATPIGAGEVTAVAVDRHGTIWAIRPAEGAPILRMGRDGDSTAQVVTGAYFQSIAIMADAAGFVHVLGRDRGQTMVRVMDPIALSIRELCRPLVGFSDVYDLADAVGGAVYIAGSNSANFLGEVQRCDLRERMWSGNRLERAQGIAIFDPPGDPTPVLRRTWGQIKVRYR